MEPAAFEQRYVFRTRNRTRLRVPREQLHARERAQRERQPAEEDDAPARFEEPAIRGKSVGAAAT